LHDIFFSEFKANSSFSEMLAMVKPPFIRTYLNIYLIIFQLFFKKEDF